LTRSNSWSNHAWGLAIDLNALTNPQGSVLRTDMPKEVGQLAAKYGLRWGGNYQKRPDAMHFEFIGTRGQAAVLTQRLLGNGGDQHPLSPTELPGAPDPPRRPGHRGEVGAVGRRRQPGRRLRPADAGRGQAVPAEPWPWRRRHRRPAHRCRAGTGAALKEQPGASRDVPGTLPRALRGRRATHTD